MSPTPRDIVLAWMGGNPECYMHTRNDELVRIIEANPDKVTLTYEQLLSVETMRQNTRVR